MKKLIKKLYFIVHIRHILLCRPILYTHKPDILNMKSICVPLIRGKASRRLLLITLLYDATHHTCHFKAKLRYC